MEMALVIGALTATQVYDQIQEAEIEEAFERQSNFWCEICDGLITDPDIDCEHISFDLR